MAATGRDPEAAARNAPGPEALGRGVVVADGAATPRAWEDAPRVRVDEDAVADPSSEEARRVVAQLRSAWARRAPIVVEFAADAAALKRDESVAAPAWQLDARSVLPRERLRRAVWANKYDARGGTPVWWHAVIAERAGAAAVSATGGGDVAAGDGTAWWVDDGPRGPAPVVGGGERVAAAASAAQGRLRPVAAADEAGQRLRRRERDLADDQQAAAAHGCGPARVLAPAGSGKTRVLAARVRHLVDDVGVDADHVTAVAYNRRAADELAARVDGSGVRVATLHALGFEVVRTARPRVRMVDDAEARAALERLAPVQPEPNTDVLAPYVEALEQVRVGLADPEEVARRRRDDAPEFVRVLDGYRSWLARGDAVDFDEQIATAVELLAADTALRSRMRARSRVLLFDEFQDLTPGMLLLVRLLAGPDDAVFAVGDDDQTIYGYRGADPAHLVDFADWFGPDPQSYQLGVNYRCPADVVAAAGRLLARNRVRVDKQARPRDGAAEEGLSIRKVDAAEAASAAVAEVRRRAAESASLSQVAVLARVRAQLLPVQLALADAGVAASPAVDATVLERTGMRAALAWLRLAAAPRGPWRGPDLAEAARRSPRRLRGATLRRLAGQETWSPSQLREVAFGELAVWEGKELRGLAGDVDEIAAAARRGGASGAVAWVRDQLADRLAALDASATAARGGGGHGDDLAALQAAATLRPALEGPQGFEAWLRDRLAAPAPSGPRVALATVHATKGLEWPHVVVVGVDDGVVPHRLAVAEGGAAAREEERRVLHVAVTRGRVSATLFADRAAPSPMLGELTSDPPAEAAAPPRRGRPRGPRRESGSGVASGPQRGGVVAAPGQQMETDTGMRGTVEHVDGSGARLRLGSGALVRVAYGETVRVGGRRGALRRAES